MLRLLYILFTRNNSYQVLFIFFLFLFYFHCFFILFFFFFFQAEDGIRDLIVTGVQTCALPISLKHHALVFYYRCGICCGLGSGGASSGYESLPHSRPGLLLSFPPIYLVFLDRKSVV